MSEETSPITLSNSSPSFMMSMICFTLDVSPQTSLSVSYRGLMSAIMADLLLYLWLVFTVMWNDDVETLTGLPVSPLRPVSRTLFLFLTIGISSLIVPETPTVGPSSV